MKMSDVAKLANVSPATVSRVLTNPSLVNKKTRDKVLSVIEEVDYKPHLVARQFRTQQTKTILVVVPDITSAFFSEVLRGIEHEALRKGYQVILGDTENSLERESNYTNLLTQKQVDGMILLTAKLPKNTLEELSETYPIVLACEYIDGLRVPTVSIDNIGAARKATEHLIELGHERVAHISGPIEIVLSKDRLRGYKQAMINNDLEVDSSYIQEGNLTIESGYNQMMKLISLETPPTGVFVYNDEMAWGAIKAAKEQGLSVPGDISIVGFDNLKLSSVVEPHLTSIGQPKYEIGNKAMELLLKMIDQEEIKQHTFVMKDSLYIRESCGTPLKKQV